MAQPRSCFDGSEKTNSKSLHKSIVTHYQIPDYPGALLKDSSPIECLRRAIDILADPGFMLSMHVCKPTSRKEVIKGGELGNDSRLASVCSA